MKKNTYPIWVTLAIISSTIYLIPTSISLYFLATNNALGIFAIGLFSTMAFPLGLALAIINLKAIFYIRKN